YKTMKVPNLRKTVLALAGAFLLGGSLSQAGEVVIDNFDDPNEATLWYWENWSIEAVIAYDDTLDAGGGASPGSMRVSNNFPNNPGGYNQSVISMSLGAECGCRVALQQHQLRCEAGSEFLSPRQR